MYRYVQYERKGNVGYNTRMFAYPNISQQQIQALQNGLPKLGFQVMPAAPGAFTVSGHGVTADAVYSGTTLQVGNIHKTGLAKLMTDSYIDQQIRRALGIQ